MQMISRMVIVSYASPETELEEKFDIFCDAYSIKQIFQKKVDSVRIYFQSIQIRRMLREDQGICKKPKMNPTHEPKRPKWKQKRTKEN